jgi:hypothetical protein
MPLRIGRRWAGARFLLRSNRNRHDDPIMVIEPDANQRNDLLVVMNRNGGVAMRINADGGVLFDQTVGFWNSETEQYERMVLGNDPLMES